MMTPKDITPIEPDDDDDFDKAFASVMDDLQSGKLYREEEQAMRAAGVDPDKPLALTFNDGETIEIIPRRSIEHLKPQKKKKPGK